jgi:hypothetical protein
MFGRQRRSTQPPKPSRLWRGVGLTPSVSPPLAQYAGLPQRLGRTLADRFGAADDLPVEIALILGALHAFIMAFRWLFR